MKLIHEFIPEPLCGYDFASIEHWFMIHSCQMILDTLFSRRIRVAENKYRRVEIDYDNNEKFFVAIRIYDITTR